MSNGGASGESKPVWPWVLLGCGILAVVAVPIMAIVAAIAIPSLLAARRSSLEVNAIGSMRAYVSAQAIYHRTDWDGNMVLEYATPYTELFTTTDKNGQPLYLIDGAFAGAQGPTGTPKQGYLYQDMKTFGGQDINWVMDFALCGVPSVYGRTGYRTFVVKTDGVVLGFEQPGQQPGSIGVFVTDYAADPVAAGWIVSE